MKEPVKTTRDIARELARKYSTMTHDELDVLESILVPRKYAKGEMILTEGDVCKDIGYVERGLVRQFYQKNGKELTEHIGVEKPSSCAFRACSRKSHHTCKWRRLSPL